MTVRLGHVRDRLPPHLELVIHQVDDPVIRNAARGIQASLSAPVVPERPEALGAAELQELRTKLLLKACILSHTLSARTSALKKMAVLCGAVQVIRSVLRSDGKVGSPLLASIQTGAGGVPRVTPASGTPVGTAAAGGLASSPLAAVLDPLVAT